MPRPTSSAPKPRCVELASVFQDPLLEEPMGADAGVPARRQYQALVAQAQTACVDCPVLERCLYAAVVEHDVAGYVGGTTPAERARIRRALRVTVLPEDLDTLAGVTGGHRQIDHDEVIRLRNAHPDESLDTLAHRLGCSLSTVKRHLRRERRNPTVRREGPAKPGLSAVLAAAAAVTNWPPRDLAA
jgi:hypothetical protein